MWVVRKGCRNGGCEGSIRKEGRRWVHMHQVKIEVKIAMGQIALFPGPTQLQGPGNEASWYPDSCPLTVHGKSLDPRLGKWKDRGEGRSDGGKREDKMN